jgi:hypothetical protein
MNSSDNLKQRVAAHLSMTYSMLLHNASTYPAQLYHHLLLIISHQSSCIIIRLQQRRQTKRQARMHKLYNAHSILGSNTPAWNYSL